MYKPRQSYVDKKSIRTTSYLPNPETINQFPSGPPHTTRAPRLPAGPGPV